MAVNRVVFGGKILIDIADSTVTPETLAEGIVAYNAKGERIVGTMKQGPQITVTDDENGGVIISGLTAVDDGAGNITTSGATATSDGAGNIKIGE